jgi:hypothetical protein
MTVIALRTNASFPLTLTLSLPPSRRAKAPLRRDGGKEREQRAETRCCTTSAQQIACVATPTTWARFSLSPRERDGVRGNNV